MSTYQDDVKECCEEWSKWMKSPAWCLDGYTTFHYGYLAALAKKQVEIDRLKEKMRVVEQLLGKRESELSTFAESEMKVR